jgi:hypothetical protein
MTQHLLAKKKNILWMFLFPVEKFYGASGRLFSTGAEIEISSCFKTQLKPRLHEHAKNGSVFLVSRSAAISMIVARVASSRPPGLPDFS